MIFARLMKFMFILFCRQKQYFVVPQTQSTFLEKFFFYFFEMLHNSSDKKLEFHSKISSRAIPKRRNQKISGKLGSKIIGIQACQISVVIPLTENLYNALPINLPCTQLNELISIANWELSEQTLLHKMLQNLSKGFCFSFLKRPCLFRSRKNCFRTMCYQMMLLVTMIYYLLLTAKLLSLIRVNEVLAVFLNDAIDLVKFPECIRWNYTNWIRR